MSADVTSKVILITGGSRGIGQALALSLAARGHRIAITGRSRDGLDASVEQLPEGSLALVADVVDEAAAAAAVKQVIAHFGHIDVLVNNAGTAGPGGPTWATPCVDWWQVHEINVKGPLLYMNNILPAMIERNRGMVINICSYAALRPTPGNSAYSSSKAAMVRLSDSVAAEVAQFNVQVFSVSPGLVRTDMTTGVPVFDDIPAHEWNSPDDICRLVHALLSQKYGELSGCFIHVRDDIDEMLQQARSIQSQGLYQMGMNNLEGPID